jgi:hypothetical protein
LPSPIARLAGKLDYIQGMGFDAVWISPIVDNLKGMTKTGEAYHGCVLSASPATRRRPAPSTLRPAS